MDPSMISPEIPPGNDIQPYFLQGYLGEKKIGELTLTRSHLVGQPANPSIYGNPERHTFADEPGTLGLYPAPGASVAMDKPEIMALEDYVCDPSLLWLMI